MEKEHRWLTVLRPQLPLPIPVPLGAGYFWPWSIYRRLDGERAHIHSIHGLDRFATDLAEFLVALREIDARDGPAAGAHNFHRGGSLSVYDAETRNSIEALADEIAVGAVVEVCGGTIWTIATGTRNADRFCRSARYPA